MTEQTPNEPHGDVCSSCEGGGWDAGSNDVCFGCNGSGWLDTAH